uniref:membrane-spanning 4-domains subfamily A member 5 isoform X2 n=1 Tax=Arvicanthis niloticus TaxID=61156 RepID=UPI0014865171|nr:membrane-spanning 4-domains subfamily A member 5 isoform X2 [Arvicanthis niloticus]
MDSKNVHSPMFLVFPPEVITPENQTTQFTATAYDPQNRVQKILIRKLEILGFINSGAFLIALKRNTTDTLIKISQGMNLLSALGAATGIILLIFGFLLDRHFICGYSPDGIQCDAITILFVGTLVMLMIFSIAELFISLFSSVVGCYSEERGGCC